MQLTRREQEQLERLRDVVFPGQTTIDEQLDEPAGEQLDGPAHRPALVVSKTIAEEKISNCNYDDTLFDL